MRKYKWYITNLNISIENISSRMLGSPFTQNVDEGFLLSRTRKNFVEGKYIEKIVISEQVENPFGYTEENRFVKYQITKFYLSDEIPIGLMITNPPKSMRSFFSAIHKIAGIGSVISEISIDPLEWATNLEKVIEKITVTSISSTGIHIANNSLAKIYISGENDIRNDFSKFIGNRYCFNQIVKLSIFDRSKFPKNNLIELQKNSTIKIFGDPCEDLIPVIKNGLIETYRLKNTS